MPAPNIRDAKLTQSVALPAADGDAVTTSIDLGAAPADRDLGALVELLASAPALGTTALPNADTLTYRIEHSTAAASSFTTLYGSILIQTGSTAAGAAAATARVRVPHDVKRYVRLAVTGAGTIGDCSGSEMTLALVF